MDPQTVVALISTLAQAAKALAPEVEKAVEILKSSDTGEIHAALAELQAAGDALHASTRSKLAQAAASD